MGSSESERTRRIRVLNDNFRTTFVGGRVVMTEGVVALPLDLQAKAVLAVQSFADFDGGNDPYHEHDFGSVEVGSEVIFFKLDYYNDDYSAGSEDPADPEHTRRVLTIMLAPEY